MKVFVGLLALFGAVAAAPNLGITGGQVAAPGAYPFAVAVQECTMNIYVQWDCVYHCTGILLSLNYGLTTATCAMPLRHRYSRLKIMVGVTYLGSYDPDRDMVDSEGFIIHPDFQEGGVSTNDIAIMKLFFGNRRRFDLYAQPAKLPVQGTEPSGDAVLIGWGDSSALKEAQVSILSQTECVTLMGDLDKHHRDAYNTTNNICTGPLTGVNATCNSDTGGILVQNGQVVGLASWAVDPCGQPGVPSVFTKINNYVDWIIDNV